MKRGALPALSTPGEVVLDHYEQVLRTQAFLSVNTIRNYLSDLRQFALWYKGCFHRWQEEALPLYSYCGSSANTYRLSGQSPARSSPQSGFCQPFSYAKRSREDRLRVIHEEKETTHGNSLQ